MLNSVQLCKGSILHKSTVCVFVFAYLFLSAYRIVQQCYSFELICVYFVVTINSAHSAAPSEEASNHVKIGIYINDCGCVFNNTDNYAEPFSPGTQLTRLINVHIYF